MAVIHIRTCPTAQGFPFDACAVMVSSFLMLALFSPGREPESEEKWLGKSVSWGSD
jgi:hypothetical protein